MSREGEVWRFRAPLEAIGYVRSIVEAYEGLAVVSSEPGRGLVTWLVAPGREDEAGTLADALAHEGVLGRRIDPVADDADDAVAGGRAR